ncbi:MAG TPA: sulfatase [Kofleriaceae bacterium]|nr:sulfatase [Kofleriaceae bacterium]
MTDRETDPETDPRPIPFGQLLAIGAITGATAAAVAGVLDGLWTWGRLSQFLPGLGSKLRLLVYLAASHALIGLLAGTLVAAVGGFYLRVTRLGNLVRHAGAEHARTRAREPRDALVGLSLVIAFIPVIALLLYFGHAVLLKQLGTRKHPGLVLAVTMIATLGLAGLGVMIAIALARLVESALRAMAVGSLAPPLSSPLAPPIAAAVMVAIGGAVIVALSWKTLRLLKLRPYLVVLVAVALAAPAHVLVARRAAARWRALPRKARIGAAFAAPVVAFFVAALGGANPSVIKAAVAYSGGGDGVTTALKRTFDFDRDGHAALFGGDDCDDFDREIHPGASDIPDDGIDQNCVAGDARLARTVDDVGFVAVPPAVPPDWNVILVTIDTLRADHVGAYGYKRPTTPVLDAIAAEGAVFEAAWAHAPSTRYSMPALLTGRLPLDVFYDTSHPSWPGLLEKATTLAEVLKPRGFVTGAITNYWYFERSRRMNQGFDSYDNENARLHQGSDPAHTKGTSSAQQTDKALAFVASHAAQRFFLWVHYYDPHHEYEAHPGVQSFGTAPVDLYDQEIRFTDQQLGRLVDDLRVRGLWQKTVVVVTGDHGEGFGEHGILLHGYDLYAAQTKVPLVVRVPGLAPRRVKTAAGHVDVMPTLANLAGAPASTEMMGRSLLPWLAGGPDDLERPVFQQLSYEGNHEKRGAATARCHVLYNISPHTSWELYDVSRDPGETRDLSGAPGPCASTRAAFERWYDVAQIPRGAAEALLATRPTITKPLDIDLGPEIRLLSVEMPAQVKAGETFDITWTFEARGRLDAGWRVFVHFEDGRNSRFTGDHAPARPFEWWRRGQYIRYTTPATVPPGAAAGTYGLWTGLWRKNARRPVKAPQGVQIVENRVRAAQIEVVRP